MQTLDTISQSPAPPPTFDQTIDRTDTVVGMVNEGVLTSLTHSPSQYSGWLGCWTQTISNREDVIAWLHAPTTQSMRRRGLVVDLWGDGQAGVAWVLDLQTRYPDLQVVACTNLYGPWIIKNVWQAGLRALVDLDQLIQDLSSALFERESGERFCSKTLQPSTRWHSTEARLLQQLGKTQRQALALIGEACDDHDIAEILQIQLNTANKLRRQLQTHFDLKSHRELATLARHLGLTVINATTTSRPWFDT